MPTIILQPASEGKDAWAREYSPDTNYGTNVEMYAGAEGTIPNNKKNRAYMHFDMSTIPPGSYINSMTLTLTVTGQLGAGNNKAPFKVTSAWGETTLTWNVQPSIGAALGAYTYNGYTWAFSAADANEYFNGAFVGIMIRAEDETYENSATKYATSDHGTAASRPKLTIDYNPPELGRKIEYVLNLLDQEQCIIDSQGRQIPYDEVLVDKWMQVLGWRHPTSETFGGNFYANPSLIYIEGVVYNARDNSLQIKGADDFTEILIARIAGRGGGI